jgi:5'(3')-deoxyribonucleotidase
VFAAAQPVDGAIQGVKRIQQAGFDYIFVTSNLRGSLEAKVDWLARHGFITDTKHLDARLVIASNKNLVSADVLIDDKPETILKWPYPRRGLLFTQPWNQWLTLMPERAEFVDDWSDVLQKLGLKRGAYAKID